MLYIYTRDDVLVTPNDSSYGKTVHNTVKWKHFQITLQNDAMHIVCTDIYKSPSKKEIQA